MKEKQMELLKELADNVEKPMEAILTSASNDELVSMAGYIAGSNEVTAARMVLFEQGARELTGKEIVDFLILTSSLSAIVGELKKRGLLED